MKPDHSNINSFQNQHVAVLTSPQRVCVEGRIGLYGLCRFLSVDFIDYFSEGIKIVVGISGLSLLFRTRVVSPVRYSFNLRSLFRLSDSDSSPSSSALTALRGIALTKPGCATETLEIFAFAPASRLEWAYRVANGRGGRSTDTSLRPGKGTIFCNCCCIMEGMISKGLQYGVRSI